MSVALTTTADVYARRAKYALSHGDGIAWLLAQPPGSLDAIVSDFPYAEIERDYGRMSEDAWREFAHGMVRAGLRALTPRGSMVVIIQPNSERIGRMRACARGRSSSWRGLQVRSRVRPRVASAWCRMRIGGTSRPRPPSTASARSG